MKTGERTVPVYDADLFTDEALADPYDHYRALRDAGPVVWLSAHDVYAVARYREVRVVLEDATTFCSGEGVGLNAFINEGGRGTTSWVPDLLGWPVDGRDRLLDWANANFDGLGPLNARAVAAGEGLLEMVAYAHQLAQSELPAGSMARGVVDAAARGDIDPARCPMAIIDYLAPSLDTTISAIGNALWLFASANRDERRWDGADEFDIMRESAAHVAFGHGEHACVGMGLARLEGTAVLSALVERVDRMELAGQPERKLNNLIRSFRSLPVRVEPA